MVKKLGALTAAALMGAIVVGGVSSAGSRIASPTEIDTIEANKIQHLIDLGKPGTSIGDVFTISDDLVTPDGITKLGHMHEICTAIRAKHLSLECMATAEFSNGQIALIGEFPPVDADASYAITGGTGAYENVGGKMTVASVGHGVLALDFFLVP